jgi:hypothetical protein
LFEELGPEEMIYIDGSIDAPQDSRDQVQESGQTRADMSPKSPIVFNLEKKPVLS